MTPKKSTPSVAEAKLDKAAADATLAEAQLKQTQSGPEQQDGERFTGTLEATDETYGLFALRVKVKRLDERAQIPRYQSAGAACFDLHALDDGHIAPGGAATFRTGLAVELAPGTCLKIYSRSGHGFNHGVRLANSVGIIDSDFRGELVARLVNDSARDVFEVKAGDRIAQALVEAAPQFEIVEVDELSETTRGADGFGSTDRKVAE